MGRIASSLTGNKRQKSPASDSTLDEPRQPLKQLRLYENRLETEILQPPTEQNNDNERHSELDNKDVRARLKEFVVLADNNKLRDNVWRDEAIDLFLKFSGYDADRDYTFAGQCLLAVVKLYLLRVDMLYEDVSRFTADFRRRDNKRSRQRDEGTDEPQNPVPDPPRQLRRTRVRRAATIASPESLNAKIVTIAAVDPFFAKLNTHVDSGKPNRLLQNVIKTTNSSLKLLGNDKFWDCNDQTDTSNILEATEQPVLMKISFAEPESLKFKVIRSTLADYRLTTACLEHHVIDYVDLCDSDIEMDDCANDEETIGAAFAMSPGNEDHAANDDFSFYDKFETRPNSNMFQSTPCIAAVDSGYQSQPNAIRTRSSESQARGSPTDGDSEDELGPPKKIILDLEPQESQQLEYSYQPMDTIRNFFAGPSHWKFLRPSRVRKVRFAPRKKKIYEKVTLASLQRFDFGQLMIQRDGEPPRVPVRQWSRVALRLLHDFKLQPDIFDRFNCSGLNIDDPKLGVTLEDEGGLHEKLHDDLQHFTEQFDDNDMTMASEPTQEFKKSLNVTSFRFKPYRRTNIKLIKDTSMSVIENEACLSQGAAVNFSAVYTKVDKLVSHAPYNSSCALTFLSLLHAAAENKVELEQEDNVNDFTILLKPQCNDEE